jgi:hypothetical protein
MHHTAHDKAATGAAGKMQSRAFFHAQMLYEPPFGKEVGRQLH